MDAMARPLDPVSCPTPLVIALSLLLSTLAFDQATATPVPTIPPTSAPAWTASGQFDGEDFGSSVAAAGDVNGDGYGDVVVGAPGWGEGFSWRGRALVYLGGRTGLSTVPAWTIEGLRDGANVGLSVSGAGDVNGDRYDDVIIGEPGFSGGRPNRGKARIIPGSQHGLQTSRAWEITGETEQEYFGETVARAGDVNGDGYDDVLVGSLTRIFLFLGRPGGIETQAAWTGPRILTAVGAGDVNGDGYDDVALIGGSETLLYLGSSTGLSSVPAWRGPPALSAGGGGDVNGDGYADLLLGPPKLPGEMVRLFLGSPQGLSPTPAWEVRDLPLSGGFWFGFSVATGGDVNRDGYADILVAAPDHFESNRWKPSVFVYLGGSAGPSPSPDWTASGETPSSFGRSVALGADVDGDGASEVLVGDPGARVGTVFTGRALLYSLGPAYPAPAITHEPVLLGTLSSPLVLEATVVDQTKYVARVEILQRSFLDSDFRAPIAMERIDGDLYRGEIPGELVLPGLVYFIRAFDNYGLASQTIPIDVDLLVPAWAAHLAPAFKVRLESDSPGLPIRISFTTSRPGPVRILLFDVQGRMVASLLDAVSLAAGRHSVPISGERFRRASGVYFYRVETVDGIRNGRFVQMH